MDHQAEKDVKLLWRQSVEEARLLSEPLVGPEHVFLALTRLNTGFLAHYLDWDYAKVATILKEIEPIRPSDARPLKRKIQDRLFLWMTTWPGVPSVFGSRFYDLHLCAKARSKTRQRSDLVIADYEFALLQELNENSRLHEAFMRFGADLENMKSAFYESQK